MFSSRDEEEWVPATDEDRQAVLVQLERLIRPPADGGWDPDTPPDRDAVIVQLERLLDDARFRFSRHHPRLLRFVVEKTIQGATDQLKERDLGVEIFGRSVDYDVNSDPIVRVTAAEIRDRIAQYYDEEEHSLELRIDLPLGSYTPRFRQPPPRAKRNPERILAEIPRPSSPLAADEAENPNVRAKSSRRGRLAVVWIFSMALVGLIAFFAPGVAERYYVNTVTSFWQFGDDRSSHVLVCVRETDPTAGVGNSESTPSSSAVPEREGMIPSSDAMVAIRIASAITSAGLTPVLRGTTQTTLGDLQQGPVVMIGALDNDWTLRLTDSLPFRFVRPADGSAYRIVDARSAMAPVYEVDRSLPYSAVSQDYGIVARFLNPITERPTVIVAGLGANGTNAAMSLVTSDDLFRQFAASAPRDWRKRNFELLLATQTRGGKAAPPKILAAQYW